MVKGLYNHIKKPFESLLLLIFLFMAASQLNVPDFMYNQFYSGWVWVHTFQKLYRVLFIVTIIWMILRIVDFSTTSTLRKIKDIDHQDRSRQVYNFIKDLIKVFLILFGLLFILSHVFYINVVSILAGLGIGGLAVALAGKESIENLFASFTIFLDRPFKIGQKVQVKDTIGFVEKVGFRSTRIRTLDRSLLILPNKQLVDEAVDNLTSRTLMRVRFMISLEYKTPLHKLSMIKEDIIRIIQEDGHVVNNDYHVRFAEFGAVGLELLIIYFIRTNSWDEYIAVKSALNERILDIIEQHDCHITFPSTSVIVKGDRDLS